MHVKLYRLKKDLKFFLFFNKIDEITTYFNSTNSSKDIEERSRDVRVLFE